MSKTYYYVVNVLTVDIYFVGHKYYFKHSIDVKYYIIIILPRFYLIKCMLISQFIYLILIYSLFVLVDCCEDSISRLPGSYFIPYVVVISLRSTILWILFSSSWLSHPFLG